MFSIETIIEIYFFFCGAFRLCKETEVISFIYCEKSNQIFFPSIDSMLFKIAKLDDN